MDASGCKLGCRPDRSKGGTEGGMAFGAEAPGLVSDLGECLLQIRYDVIDVLGSD